MRSHRYENSLPTHCKLAYVNSHTAQFGYIKIKTSTQARTHADRVLYVLVEDKALS